MLAEWSDGVPRDKYTSLRRILETNGTYLPSLRCKEAALRGVTKIQPCAIDCCFNNCIAFTGKYSNLKDCPECKEPRFYPQQASSRAQARAQLERPRNRFLYIPLTWRLQLQYQDPTRSRLLKSYRASLLKSPIAADGSRLLRDVFDGDLFHSFHLREKKLFQDPHDIALHLSLDGVQLTNMRHHEVCFPFVSKFRSRCRSCENT
jgi:hypothetical protein